MLSMIYYNSKAQMLRTALHDSQSDAQ